MRPLGAHGVVGIAVRVAEPAPRLADVGVVNVEAGAGIGKVTLDIVHQLRPGGEFETDCAKTRLAMAVRFAFRVGNTYMPAGHYVLREKSADGLLYSLKHSQTGKSVMVLCPVSDDSRPNRLIFGKDEKGYVLTRVR